MIKNPVVYLSTSFVLLIMSYPLISFAEHRTAACGPVRARAPLGAAHRAGQIRKGALPHT
jgi:hypothetical protein